MDKVEAKISRQMSDGQANQVAEMSSASEQMKDSGLVSRLTGFVSSSLSHRSAEGKAAEEMTKRRRNSVHRGADGTDSTELSPTRRTSPTPSLAPSASTVPSDIAQIVLQLNTWLRVELPSRFDECDRKLAEIWQEFSNRFAILEEQIESAQNSRGVSKQWVGQTLHTRKPPPSSPKEPGSPRAPALRNASKHRSLPLAEMLKAIRGVDDTAIRGVDDTDHSLVSDSDRQPKSFERCEPSSPVTLESPRGLDEDDRLDEIPVQVPTSSVTILLRDSADESEFKWSDTVQPDRDNSCTQPLERTGSRLTSQSSASSSKSRRPRPSLLDFQSRSNSFDLPSIQHVRQTSGSVGSKGSFQGFKGSFQEKLRRTRKRPPWAVKLWSFLDDPESFAYGHAYVQFMTVITLLGVCIPVMQSLDPPPLDAQTQGIADICFDGLLFIEVCVRFYVCPNRFKFLQSMYNIVDISALMLTFFLKVSLGLSVTARQTEERGRDGFTGLACLLPVLRLLRLVRRFQTFHLILKAFRMALEALPVLIYTLAVLVLSFASIIYVVEPPTNIESYSHSLWFVIVTVGTIGYGDTVPKDTLGKITSSALIVVSALYMAMPLGIVGKAFGDVWDEKDRILLLQRTRASFLSAGYEAQDVPTMFMSFDNDGDGQLSLREFAEMMDMFDIDISQGRIAELFQAFDDNGSGYIDDREFVKALFPAVYDDMYEEDESTQGTEEVQVTENVAVTEEI